MLYPERFTHYLLSATIQAVAGIGMIIAGLTLSTIMQVAILPETISAPDHNPHGLDRVLL